MLDRRVEDRYRRGVNSWRISSGFQYDLKIAGNLKLNGSAHSITIPTKLTVTGNEIRAQGEFSVRSDFKVKATSAVHGLVRIRDRVKFTFDIVGHQFQPGFFVRMDA